MAFALFTESGKLRLYSLTESEVLRICTCTPPAYSPCSRRESDISRASLKNIPQISSGVLKSAPRVTERPMLLGTLFSSSRDTGELSSPKAQRFNSSPFFPSRRSNVSAEHTAASPIVQMPQERSFSVVLRPAKSRSETGSRHIFSLKFSRDITVMPSGFFISDPSFAKTLLKLTPTETVIPSSRFISRRILSAISSPLPKSRRLPVTSSQHSSMPKGSIISVYSS